MPIPEFITLFTSLHDSEYAELTHFLENEEASIQPQTRQFLLMMQKTASFWQKRVKELQEGLKESETLRSAGLHAASSTDLCLDLKHELFQAFFQEPNYNDQKLRNLLAKSNRSLKRFITDRIIPDHKNSVDFELTQARFYLERGLDSLFKKTIRSLKKGLAEGSSNSEVYFEIMELETEYRVRHNLPELNHQSLFEVVQSHYSLQLIKIGVAMLSARRVKGIPVTQQDMSRLTTILRSAELSQDPRLRYWKEILKVELNLLPLSVETLSELKNLLSSLREHLNRDEQKMMYLVLYNLFIRLKRSDTRSMHDHIFEIWEYLNESDLLRSDGVIHQHHFLCAVIAGTRLKKTEWVANFIQIHKDKLHGEESASVFTLANAWYLYFLTDNTDQIKKMLNNLQFRQTRYELRKRSLFAMLVYDSGDFNYLETLYERERKFTRDREGISDSAKKAYSNFYRILNGLGLARQNNKQPPVHYLEEIERASIVEKQWLKQKIDQWPDL